MIKRQRGVSLLGLVGALIIVVIAALIGMKIVPAYIEYGMVKKAVVGIVQSGDAKGTVTDIKASFRRRAQIDDIDVIKAEDLDITKNGNEVVISFSYQKKIPLLSNISLLIDFSGSSN